MTLLCVLDLIGHGLVTSDGVHLFPTENAGLCGSATDHPENSSRTNWQPVTDAAGTYGTVNSSGRPGPSVMTLACVLPLYR